MLYSRLVSSRKLPKNLGRINYSKISETKFILFNCKIGMGGFRGRPSAGPVVAYLPRLNFFVIHVIGPTGGWKLDRNLTGNGVVKGGENGGGFLV